jgi:hypothetical protein
MTIQELNDLIARGAAQPGVRDVEDLMRLGLELDQQARALADISGSMTAVASSSGVTSVTPTDAAHADLG